jgi:hypothetical protein
MCLVQCMHGELFERGTMGIVPSGVMVGSIGKTDIRLLLLFEAYSVQTIELSYQDPLSVLLTVHYGCSSLKSCTFALQTCPKLPRCFLLLSKGQGQDILTLLLLGPLSPKQPFPHLTGVAKAAATLPWSPVFFRTYGDPSKDDPPGGECHPVHRERIV